ncbi:MAG: hypothetical protein BWX74_00852 [Tenericutes bacterium ADurb.Bin087]|nr:MAG: hypothetical protein BWX74_00852 [Tenericutes bacterium ADurb.Bin087]
MNKVEKILTIIASSLLVVGLIVFITVMAVRGFDFSGLSTVKYEVKTHEVTEEYANIKVDITYADLTIVKGEEATTKALCYESDRLTYTLEVEDDTLVITDTHKMRRFWTIFDLWGNKGVTLYVPNNAYTNLLVNNETGSLTVANSVTFNKITARLETGSITLNGDANVIDVSSETGSITLNNVDADSAKLVTETGKTFLNNVNVTGDITISADTGAAKLTDVKSDNLTIDAETVTITLTDTVITNTMNLETETGSINFVKSDAHDIYARTSTGSINGSLLTGKIFSAHSKNGTVSVPSNTAGAGVCDLRTNTGNITITIG